MISLKPPTTSYSSIGDVGRFNMIWSVSLVLIPVFLLLLIMHLIFGDPSWRSSGIGLLVAMFNIFYLYRTRKFKLIAITSVILGTLICQFSIFVVADSRVIADAMWCILVGFFTFFLIGTTAGVITMLLNLSGLLVYISTANYHEIIEKGTAEGTVDYKMIINVIYVALAMSYVIHKMRQNNSITNKRYEQENQQKEILLKEIHHRVKNNLQIISSLLKLQAAESKSESVNENFQEAIGRIRSMALIHEKMYHNDDLSKIDLRTYVITLAEDICSSIYSKNNLEINVDSSIEQVETKNIVPISLIFNELVTNSLKHGFINQDNAKIEVKISQNEDSVLFEYQDNGIWVEPTETSSFGLDLIDTLTDQLEGSYSRHIEDGTLYRFQFDKNIFFFS